MPETPPPMVHVRGDGSCEYCRDRHSGMGSHVRWLRTRSAHVASSSDRRPTRRPAIDRDAHPQ
jgi:hypothetical protein